jgi:hypothetical protein
MLDADRYKLRFGPYRPPRCRVGRWLRCALRGRVKVTGISDAPIQWPQTKRDDGAGRPYLIVCGRLVDAIRRESNQAVAHHWGVTPQTVTVWRKALGVPRANEGTSRLQAEWMPERLDDAARERQREACRNPERCAKIAAAKLGKPRPPHVPELLRAAARARKRTPRPWQPGWDALLGTTYDANLARRLGMDSALLPPRVSNCPPLDWSNHEAPCRAQGAGHMAAGSRRAVESGLGHAAWDDVRPGAGGSARRGAGYGVAAAEGAGGAELAATVRKRAAMSVCISSAAQPPPAPSSGSQGGHRRRARRALAGLFRAPPIDDGR